MELAITREVPSSLYIRTEDLAKEIGNERVLAMVEAGVAVAGQRRYDRKRSKSPDTPLTAEELAELEAMKKETEEASLV